MIFLVGRKYLRSVGIWSMRNMCACSLETSYAPKEELFCKCLKAVMSNRALEVVQTDKLNILKPWNNLELIDNEEMVRCPLVIYEIF